ncbi:MAG: hypothetical protein LAT53_02740 [Idiomarina sp.]|nr:hypothetical protein [Idiomarina sp.]
MDIVERYIAAVQRELPEQKREDIGRELNANILDKIEALEAQKGAVTDTEVAEVLYEMGSPRSVALQFCPPTPLIATWIMPLYLNTLYVVLGVLFLLSLIGVTSNWLSGTQMSLLLFMKSLASEFLNHAYFAFTAITIGFAVIGRKPKNEEPQTCTWSPEKLPPAGKSWQHISLQSIFSDLATMLFLVMLIWYPLWQSNSGAQSIFTPEVLTILLWFTPVILVAIAHSIWQLRVRLWNRTMLLLNIAVSTAFLLVSLWIMLNTPILRIYSEAWEGAVSIASIERSIFVVVFVVAIIAAYEVIRDTRRLFRI